MNSISVSVRPSSRSVEFNARTKRIGAAVFGIAVMGLELWLRFPIQPMLESYLQTIALRTASTITFIFRKPSFFELTLSGEL